MENAPNALMDSSSMTGPKNAFPVEGIVSNARMLTPVHSAYRRICISTQRAKTANFANPITARNAPQMENAKNAWVTVNTNSRTESATQHRAPSQAA
jgi:hypothetical protein